MAAGSPTCGLTGLARSSGKSKSEVIAPVYRFKRALPSTTLAFVVKRTLEALARTA
jgi:hypothetical protein